MSTFAEVATRFASLETAQATAVAARAVRDAAYQTVFAGQVPEQAALDAARAVFEALDNSQREAIGLDALEAAAASAEHTVRVIRDQLAIDVAALVETVD